MLLALKFGENWTELSFISEVNKDPKCALNRLLSQVLGSGLESPKSAGEEIAIRSFIKKSPNHHQQKKAI